ncbi:ABC transporter permease subunit [Bacillus tuaregi]|uniref:ABC transporter permease subunit n=1 Tax=Bacillus tuaregi TaxID=1816695 RepID=UPI0008F8A3B4|nr:ABC transporter permease [Bacillus tuaregi]
MIKLVQNEMMKILARKRLIVIALITAVLVGLFTYAQYKQTMERQEKLGTDWRAQVQAQVVDISNRLSSSRMSEDLRERLQITLKQSQYYLDHDINPNEPGAPSFVRMFIENSGSMFIPLLVMVIASDLVSSEHTLGSIKLLLTRPVKRWRILSSKYIALVLSISIIIAVVGLLAYLISGLVFGYKGMNAPILTGFTAEGGSLDTSQVRLISQWKFIFMDFGLVWFVAIVIGTLSFMLSVLIRSTAAGMGIMLAALISGSILSNMVSAWEFAKYLFMVNLNLTGYLSGAAPPIEGMTLLFSITLLAFWWLAGFIVSFLVFTNQDVY